MAMDNTTYDDVNAVAVDSKKSATCGRFDKVRDYFDYDSNIAREREKRDSDPKAFKFYNEMPDTTVNDEIDYGWGRTIYNIAMPLAFLGAAFWVGKLAFNSIADFNKEAVTVQTSKPAQPQNEKNSVTGLTAEMK